MGSSPPDDIPIVARIRSYFSLLRATKEEVEQIKIPGLGEKRFKHMVYQLVDDLIIDLKEHVSTIEELEDVDTKSELSESIHRSLEAFLNWIDVILRHCNAVSLELHEFVSYILKDLNLENIDYLLLSGSELSEASLSEGLSKLFIALFEKARDRITREFPSFCIIFIPQSLLKNPINWSLCVHEIGHMVENERLRIVENFYPRPEFSPVSTRIMYNSEALKHWYSKEFQADFFAQSYCGPIFTSQLVDNFFTKEIFILPTHPSWEERTRALAEELRKMKLEDFARRLMERAKELPHSDPLIKREALEHLSTIIDKTKNFLLENNSIYEIKNEKLESVRESLENFVPYTDDVKVLLNVAEEVKRTLLDSTKGLKRKEKIEIEFDNLIEDSIRLSNLKRIKLRGN